jgi:hypothetical protein
MALPTDLDFTPENVRVGSMKLDLRVNPRDPSDAWARRQMSDGGYNRGLLGVFILSERLLEGGGRDLIILDGANRQLLVEMAEDSNYEAPSSVFHGLTEAQEAEVAREYNDRRNWTGIRKFQTLVTMGDPIACRIEATFAKRGWRISTETDNGVIHGVAPIDRLIKTAGTWAVADSNAPRETEAWHAAMANGREDAFRVLEQAIDIYNVAFPTKPSGYAPDMMQALSLVLLRYGSKVDLGRMTENLMNHSRGQRSFRNDARATKDTYKLSMTDAYAFQAVLCYNVGFTAKSREALPKWEKTGR